MSVATNTRIQQNHVVADTTLFSLWTTMRWYRAPKKTGPFEACTQAAVGPATLLFVPITTVLTGKILSLSVNGVPNSMTITGPDPVTPASLAAQIHSAFPAVTATGDATSVTLSTTLTGTAASIAVLSCDAAPFLGLISGTAALGVDVDATLNSAVAQYFLNDQQSASTYFYCVEFWNGAEKSERSVPVKSRPTASIPVSSMVTCYLRLASLSGLPLPERDVTIHNVFLPNTITASGIEWGLFRQYEEKKTDVNGYVEFQLVSGAVIDVNIGGTGVVRRVTVPDDTSAPLNLLGPIAGANDEFEIQQQNVDFAIRTT